MSKIRVDYCTVTVRRQQRRRFRLRWFALGLCLPAVVVSMMLSTHDADANRHAELEDSLALKKNLNLSTELALRIEQVNEQENDTGSEGPLPQPQAVPAMGLLDKPATDEPIAEPEVPDLPQADETWDKIVVRRGETLSEVFNRNNLSSEDTRLIAGMGEGSRALIRGLNSGDELYIRRDDAGRLTELLHDINHFRTLHIRRNDGNFEAEVFEAEPERRTYQASAVIDSSFYLAAKEAGLTDRLTMNLAKIYSWDIDFALDIRKGDTFSVVYEKIYRNGKYVRDGDILAVEFVNRNRSKRAIRYTDSSGHTEYYDPEGRPMKKAFLRMPLDYGRVSSHFNLRRRHPVLNRIRAHRGTDYAASTGTPIKASGDGRIIYRGWKGGYGNAIIIKHGGGITTLYGHMSRFRSGLSNGSRVKQGQIIGYVGASGLATGPHLHYEFRVNGIHKNPMTVKLPDAAPLPQKYLTDFKTSAAAHLARLDTLSTIQLASTAADSTEEG